MMDKSHITEKILKLTLEIIYLLTGEDYLVVNKTGKHVGTICATPCQPRGLQKTVRPVTDPPPPSEVHEKNNNEKILDLANKITELLTGEVPIRSEDIIVCFTMEEWEYVEGHKELYKHLITENHTSFGSSDFPSAENLASGSLPSLTSPDTACKDDLPRSRRPNAKNSVLEDVQELPLPVEHERLTHALTCTKYTQTDLADVGKESLYEHKEADVVLVPTDNAVTGHSAVASRPYNGGDQEDSDLCLITEQIQNAAEHMGGEVESGEDGVLAGDQIYPPPCLKSTNLRGHPPEWVTNLNYVDYPITPRHINAPYTPSCIIEVATVCEEGDFTSPDIYTPTAHKTTLHASDKAEETPMSWGKDVIYTKFYTPEELTQADLTSIKKELVSWEDGGMELQNVYVRPKRREDKAASARGDAAPWSRGQAHRDSYLSLENAALHIKTEYDQGDFGDHSGTSGQLQPLHAGNLEDCRGAMIKKANATKTMSIISYSTDDENDSGRAAYAVSQLYGCADCKKCFTNDTNLAKHRLLCRGRKPHVCSACGKCFASASYLVIHERIHTGEKPYSCSHCGKSFTRKPDLIRHERIHTGEKPFSCPECGKCFTSVSNIFMHRRIHTGEKPFPCAECGKRFIKKSDLVRHEKIHLPQKPLPCSHCGHFFSSKTMLSKHMALHAAAEPGAAHGGS